MLLHLLLSDTANQIQRPCDNAMTPFFESIVLWPRSGMC